MALIICHKHGESDVSFASQELVNCVLSGALPPDAIRAVQLEIDPSIRSRHWVDSPFARRLAGNFGLTGDPLVVPPGEPSFEVLCDLVPVCRQCMQEWLRVLEGGLHL
jgi:hypothetical protein